MLLPSELRLLRAALPVLALLLAAAPARAQRADTTGTRLVEILGADSLTQSTRGGEAVRMLIGNVRLRQGRTDLRARVATEYPAREEIVFQGDVRIADEGDTLRADQVTYHTRTKVGRARGRVEVTDGEVDVFAPAGTYFLNEKRAVFEESVRLVDSAAVLTSRGGSYWLDDKRAEFYGDVRVDEERSLLSADSVTHFRESRVSVARGNVFLLRYGGEEDTTAVDSSIVTYLYGARAHHDNRRDSTRVEGLPLLVQLQTDSTGTDTLVIRARLFQSTRRDSLRRLIAVDSVRIWQPSFAALADSAVYERVRRREPGAADSAGVRHEELRLFGAPIGWFEETQVTGDSVRMLLRDGEADSLFIPSDAFVVQRDTAVDRMNQLRGRRLVGRFDAGELRQLVVGPNAEAIYYMKSETDSLEGGVKLSADERIALDFVEDEVRAIRASPKPEGEYYEADALPEPFRLEGFRWEPGRRPLKEGLLDPRFPPAGPPPITLRPPNPDPGPPAPAP